MVAPPVFPRFELAPPIHGGSVWWEITDTWNDMTVATFFGRMPLAEETARALLARLNAA
jgi:hypothetical protein